MPRLPVEHLARGDSGPTGGLLCQCYGGGYGAPRLEKKVPHEMTASIDEFQLRHITYYLLGPPVELISKDNVDGKFLASHYGLLVRVSRHDGGGQQQAAA